MKDNKDWNKIVFRYEIVYIIVALLMTYVVKDSISPPLKDGLIIAMSLVSIIGLFLYSLKMPPAERKMDKTSVIILVIATVVFGCFAAMELYHYLFIA